jgi:hypothetical protein
MTKDVDAYGFRPSTANLAKQLDAVYDFNKHLPPKKKKDILPDIAVPNVFAKPYLRREPPKKKSKIVPKPEIAYKHFNVGFVDGSNLHNPDLPRNAAENFTIKNQSRGL